MTRNERRVLDALAGERWMTVEQLRRKIGRRMSPIAIRNALTGLHEAGRVDVRLEETPPADRPQADVYRIAALADQLVRDRWSFVNRRYEGR